jgi:hypothetical protein
MLKDEETGDLFKSPMYPEEQKYITDEEGRQWVKDEEGNLRPPMQTTKKTKSSGFMVYDMSQGHCGLCGRLDCSGNCFR